MAEPIDFRSYRKAPPAPPAPAATALPGEGRLPLQPGTVIPVDRLTPAERAGLEQIGWKPGTGVPTNLADAIARATADHAHELPVRPDTPPLVVTETPIDRLPEERKWQLAAAVQQADLQRKHLESLPRIEQPGFQHGIDAAIAAASAIPPVPPPRGADVSPPTPQPPSSPIVGLYSRTVDPSSSVTEPRTQAVSAPGPYTAEERTNHLRQLRDWEQTIHQLRTRVAELEADRPGSGAIATPNCPHCGWDLERPDEVEPTEEDKLGYLAMLLGGAAVRFTKDVPLYGGQLVVRFRTLTYPERCLTNEQAGWDLRSGKIFGDGEYFNNLIDYRLVLSIERVILADRGEFPVPEATSAERLDGEHTVLPRLRDWFTEQVLPSEMVVMAIKKEFIRFQALIEKLTATASNPDFWAGIGGPR
jgi:hypothetical protein